MDYDHSYYHSVSPPYADSFRGYSGLERSDGPVYPSNFSKVFVHESHPITGSSPWGSVTCNYHNNKADYNCVKCHPSEVLPSACPDCHNSGNDKGSTILTEDYGSDVHAGINIDVVRGKSVTSANGGYPMLVVDNDENTAWVPDDVSNQIIEVDLGDFYIVDGVRIAMGNYKATYLVEGLDNSSNWVTLVSSTTYTNYGNDKTFTFGQQNVSKVRFDVSAWERVGSGDSCWPGYADAATVPQQPEVKSINVYMPNDLPVTAANPTSHIVCQACHGGDVPNDVQPTIPECTDCHPESSGSQMQVMPSNTSIVTRQLEDY
ncbi:MAG: discoidin domain-containing protein, partial [Anaerolineales bacterium]|nr:discoidin domain-containing protein [Anaerolineales bacterium]